MTHSYVFFWVSLGEGGVCVQNPSRCLHFMRHKKWSQLFCRLETGLKGLVLQHISFWEDSKDVLLLCL